MTTSSVGRFAADLTSTDPVERNTIWVDVVHEDARGVTYNERVLVDSAQCPSYQGLLNELLAALNTKTGLAASIKSAATGKAAAK